MQITKFTLNKTHYSWGESISGTVTFKMGSNEQISANYDSGIILSITPTISITGESIYADTDGGSNGAWPEVLNWLAVENVTIGKGVTKTVSFQGTLPLKSQKSFTGKTFEEEWIKRAEQYGVDLTSGDRLQPFMRIGVTATDSYGEGRTYYAEKVYNISGGFLYERIAPQISNLQIKDKFPGNQNGLIRRFLLGGQSKPVITCDVTLDPLDPTLTGTQKVEIIELYVDPENAVLTEASGDLGSELMPTLPMETGNESGIKSAICHLIVTDNFGASSSVDEYIQLYDYAGSPQLSVPVGYELAERYNAVVTDEGGTEYVLADDGLNVWLSFNTKISRIAPSTTGIEGVDFGSNRWYLDITYGEIGGEMTTIADAASGTDATPSESFEHERQLLEGIVFDPVKKYTISITLRDAVGNSATLTTYIDKAGGYLNVEKHGVSIGMRSTGTPENPIFECDYPAYFYGGIMLGGGSGDYPAFGEEVKTGGKWSDGKPIYRAIIETGAKTANTMKYDVSAFSIEHYISIQGMFYAQEDYADGYVFPAPATHMNNASWTIQLEAENRTTITTGAANRTWKSGWILIEYTKTTDEVNESLLMDSAGYSLTDANNTPMAAAASDGVYQLNHTGAQIDQAISQANEMYSAFSNGSLNGKDGVGIVSIAITEVE